MALRNWATRLFAEDAPPLKTIQLSQEGMIWETWAAPFGDLGTWLAEVEAVKTTYAEECPKRRIPLLFTAIDAEGAIHSQCPDSVQGKNLQADAMVGAGGGSAKAFADAMGGISNLIKSILACAQQQQESSAKTMASQAEQIHDLIEYHRTKQELELTEQKTNNGVQEVVMEQVKQILPMLPQALELWAASQAKNPVTAAPAVVAQAATPIINGASKTP